MVIQFIYSLIFYLYLDNEIYHFPSFLTIKKKKKKRIITLNPPVIWAKISLPTRGLKNIT